MKQALASRTLAVIAALAIWATGAYPPWKISYELRRAADQQATPEVTIPSENDWLIKRPQGPFASFMKQQSGAILPDTVLVAGMERGIGYSVDYGRLLVEWVIIAALYAACWAALRPFPNQ